MLRVYVYCPALNTWWESAARPRFEMFLNDGDIGDSNLSCHGVIMRGGAGLDRGHTAN